MKNTKKVKWQGVSLPVPFINDIKEYIKDKNEYRNVPAFVIDAIRDKMEHDSLKEHEILKALDKRVKELKEYAITTDDKGKPIVISSEEADRLERLPGAKKEAKVPLTKEVYECMDELVKRHVKNELKKKKENNNCRL